MRKLQTTLLAAAAITLAGCETFKGYQLVSGFSSHPLFLKAVQAGATQADILAIQKPQSVMATRGGSSQCFDYQLEKGGKNTPFYVGYTDSGRVNASGFTHCSDALKAGYLNSNEIPKQIY